MFDLSIQDEVARLTLSRPQARNAIPIAGWSALAAAAREAERAEARLLVLLGEGTAFCAGADVSEFSALHGDLEAASRFRLAMREGIEAVAGLPFPTIAAIHGACYGAGVALAMACDLRVAGPAAQFAITPAKFGIAYPQEDVCRLVALVGPAQAARLLFTAASIDGEEAARIGLASHLAPGNMAEHLAALEATILANDPESLVTLKRAIAMVAADVDHDDAQDAAFDRLMASETLARRLPRPRA